MLIAGEASGDLLAAELVAALHDQSSILHPPSSPVFFGAGGLNMSAAGVELVFEMSQFSVIGITDVMKNFFAFRRLFNNCWRWRSSTSPTSSSAWIMADSTSVSATRSRNTPVKSFSNWNPKIVQFVSPQVWASRPGRAHLLAADYDLLLSIFPFEKYWYARRVPQLRVEFVGHPMIGRFTIDDLRLTIGRKEPASTVNRQSQILLLPGSRADELRRHLPVMLGALKLIREKLPAAKAKMVLPDETLKQLADKLSALPSDMEIQIGNLPQALAQADVAIASTGTVTMECAFFGVPTVTLYKTSWSTYQIGKRIVKVKWLTMPNILADEEIFPEFVQNAATPENIAAAALELLQNETRRMQIKKRLAQVVSSLGGPGATARAATAILSLFS